MTPSIQATGKRPDLPLAMPLALEPLHLDDVGADFLF